MLAMTATTTTPGTVTGLHAYGADIDIHLDATGTVTFHGPDNCDDLRALAALTDDDPTCIWADHAITGLTHAFDAIPLEDGDSIAAVLRVVLAADTAATKNYWGNDRQEPRVALTLLSHPDPAVVRHAADTYNLPVTPNGLQVLATTSDPDTALNLHTRYKNHPDAQAVAATNPHADVRAAIAGRIDATGLDSYLNDPDPIVRAGAATNNHLTDDQLRALATDKHRKVVAAVRARPNAAKEAASDLLFGDGVPELERLIGATRDKAGYDKRGVGVIEWGGVHYRLVAIPKAKKFHIAAEDPDGQVAKGAKGKNRWGPPALNIKEEGTWASSAMCGAGWIASDPDSYNGVTAWGATCCRSCLKKVAKTTA